MVMVENCFVSFVVQNFVIEIYVCEKLVEKGRSDSVSLNSKRCVMVVEMENDGVSHEEVVLC